MTVRRVDFSPDEFIAGIAGELTADQFAVYWLICSLIYSKRAPIPDEATRQKLCALLKKMHRRTVDAAIEALVAMRKVELIESRNGAEIDVKRCREEIEKASSRIRTASQNGSKGGRPQSVDDTETNDINALEKAAGFNVGLQTEKLSPTITTNHQPSPPDRGASRKGAFALPTNWKPSDEGYAAKLGIVNGHAAAELTKFVGYFTVGKGSNKRRTSRGWDQSWMNWLNRVVERRGGSDAPGPTATERSFL